MSRRRGDRAPAAWSSCARAIPGYGCAAGATLRIASRRPAWRERDPLSQELIDFGDDAPAFAQGVDLDPQREQIQREARVRDDAVNAGGQHAGVDARAHQTCDD